MADIDRIKTNLTSLLTMFPDTDEARTAALLRSRLRRPVKEALEGTHTHVLVPATKPVEPKDMVNVDVEWRIATEHKASVSAGLVEPEGVPTSTNRGVLHPEPRAEASARAEATGSAASGTDGAAGERAVPGAAGAWRKVRVMDHVAAIIGWLERKFAVLAKDRALPLWLKLLPPGYVFDGDLTGTMQEVEDTVRHMKRLTAGCTDLAAWEDGLHVTNFLQWRLPADRYPEINNALFYDQQRGWETIKERAHTRRGSAWARWRRALRRAARPRWAW